MNSPNIKNSLSEFDQYKVDRYIRYCESVLNAKTKDKGQWVDKNPWMQKRTDDQLSGFFKSVENDGLDFDGKHITLISHGISYDYIAYKNKMLLAYPETLIDIQMVYKDDSFQFQKKSGKVTYTHDLNNPFEQTEKDVKGGYCIIKNSRGEFITLLSSADIDKHRKVAKTDSFWTKWFVEMAMKTIIKKACKIHFADIFQTIETLDNEQNDVEQSLTISIETKQDLEAILTVPELNSYYKANEGKNAGMIEEFTKSCADRKAQIVEELANADN